MISKFVNKDECLILDIFIISKDRFILQFYNKNDLILNDYKTCKLTFSNDLYDHYSILETSLNTIDKFEKPLIRSFRGMINSKGKSISVEKTFVVNGLKKCLTK